MSGPPPETTQDRTQTKDTHPMLGQKLKFLIPPGIEPGPPGWKAGTLPTTPRRRMKSSSFFLLPFFLLHIFFLSQSRIYTPQGLKNSNARRSDAFTRSNRLWTRTLDRYT